MDLQAVRMPRNLRRAAAEKFIYRAAIIIFFARKSTSTFAMASLHTLWNGFHIRDERFFGKFSSH